MFLSDILSYICDVIKFCNRQVFNSIDRVSIKIFQNMPEEAPWDKIRVRDAGYNLLHNNGKKNSVRWK